MHYLTFTNFLAALGFAYSAASFLATVLPDSKTKSILATVAADLNEVQKLFSKQS
jgi:hypothetical protein